MGEQSEALQKVEELQKRSIELECEVELRRAEAAAKTENKEPIIVPQPTLGVSAVPKEVKAEPCAPTSGVSAVPKEGKAEPCAPTSGVSTVPKEVKAETCAPTVGAKRTSTGGRRISLGGAMPP